MFRKRVQRKSIQINKYNNEIITKQIIHQNITHYSMNKTDVLELQTFAKSLKSLQNNQKLQSLLFFFISSSKLKQACSILSGNDLTLFKTKIKDMNDRKLVRNNLQANKCVSLCKKQQLYQNKTPLLKSKRYDLKNQQILQKGSKTLQFSTKNNNDKTKYAQPNFRQSFKSTYTSFMEEIQHQEKIKQLKLKKQVAQGNIFYQRAKRFSSQKLNKTKQEQQHEYQQIKSIRKTQDIIQIMQIKTALQDGIKQMYQIQKDKFMEKNKRLPSIKQIKQFQLSRKVLSQQGKKDFNRFSACVKWRGGWPYFPPIVGWREGLRVRGNYDNGNDRWLQKDGLKGEWVSAYHGVWNPINFMKIFLGDQKESISQKIQLQFDRIPTLKAGDRQAYSYVRCLNKPDQQIGIGVYLTPHFDQALNYANNEQNFKIKQKSYRLVIQCRIKPQEIKICPIQDYWVINNSQFIRPYAIILVKQQDAKSYPPSYKIYGYNNKFTWNRYKDQIEANIEKMESQYQQSLD